MQTSRTKSLLVVAGLDYTPSGLPNSYPALLLIAAQLGGFEPVVLTTLIFSF